MLDLNDPRWRDFKGGYQVVYDASSALKRLEKTDDPLQISAIFEELWAELHHQGDVNVASYMALPHLIRIAREKKLTHADIPALVAVIEVQRHINSEPIPAEFEEDYLREIKQIADVIALNKTDWDREYTVCASAAIAAVNGQVQLAKVIMDLDDYDYLGLFEKFMDHAEQFERWLQSKK